MNQSWLCLDCRPDQIRTDLFARYFPVGGEGRHQGQGHQGQGHSAAPLGLLDVEGAAMAPALLPFFLPLLLPQPSVLSSSALPLIPPSALLPPLLPPPPSLLFSSAPSLMVKYSIALVEPRAGG